MMDAARAQPAHLDLFTNYDPGNNFHKAYPINPKLKVGLHLRERKH